VQIVSTDCPSGPSEILCGGDYGQLVPINNVKALSVAMLKSINSPINKDRLVERSKDFLVDRIAVQYQNFLLEV
jgi:glycosyltransferase involved in cell wall biosynthesis